MENKKKSFDISSMTLHLLAMVLMLLDHLWGVGISNHDWMTNVGRLAFPLFAFMIVEGYFHTRSFKRYMLRMLVFAVISEIPFNLMMGGTIVYPFHQNVLWTFIIGLAGIRLIEKVKIKGRLWLTIIVSMAVVLLGYLLGILTMVDYNSAGVLTVFAFYFFRGRKWWCLIGQIISLYWINVSLLSGYCFDVTIFGMNFEIVRQGLALLALIPIWLYKGRRGHNSKVFQYACYAFYPVHMMIIGIILKIL